jgi:flagellin
MALTRINNNIAAINANRNLSATGKALSTSLERLSSGLRINRASDDAAGLTISENLRSQINGLNQAVENASTAINLVNTAEGALNETTARLQRIRTLAVQASNSGTNDTVALQAIQDEIETSISEITRIGNDTQFATRRLINGDNSNTVSFLDGANLGVSLANRPTNSTLSTGTRYLAITQTNAGSETLSNGADGVNDSGATNFTGSTFDTGTYSLVLSNVRAAAARVVSSTGSVTDSSGTTIAAGTDNLIGQTFRDGSGGTFVVGTGDEISFNTTQSDGTVVTTTFTVAAGGLTAAGIVTQLNTDIGTDTAAYDATTGQFTVTAAATGAGNPLNITFSIDDNGGGAPVEFSSANTVRTAGNANDGVLTFGSGAALSVVAGQTVTANGPVPTNSTLSTPQITFTLGSAITQGTDLVTIVQQSYTGSLEGGSTVTFQNGDRNVQFRSGTGGGFASGESVTLNFDSNIDLNGGTSRTFQLSAVNKSLAFQVGANQNQRVRVAFGDLRATNLGFVGETQPNGNGRTVAGVNVTTLTGANEAIAIVDEAISQVDSQRSSLGAFTNRLEATIANLGVASENLTASESRIRDADIAAETTRFTRNQILLQAGTSILAQANLAPQGVLALLR